MIPALLVATVVAVGIFHTMVPDHWAPIAFLARSRGWSRGRTARTAALAGLGHVTSTLALGLLAWAVGLVAAARYGALVNDAAALALVGFGLWILASSIRELRSESGGHDGHGGHSHSHAHSHSHVHTHADGAEHAHSHDPPTGEGPEVRAGAAPVALREPEVVSRMALLLILGSSPMVEGLPAFFAAATLGVITIVGMAVLFGLATIATYVVLSTAATEGLGWTGLGRFERYGEVVSGAVVMAVGILAFFI